MDASAVAGLEPVTLWLEDVSHQMYESGKKYKGGGVVDAKMWKFVTQMCDYYNFITEYHWKAARFSHVPSFENENNYL